ncbi:hypothetical protein SAMN02745166_05130 [Prosthecobacter debontii]|uniref:Uncharacterized protein n=1 Tax=Prosthecobacter debontii TaxID=48467 RepID=A0A1T4Z5K6_9BACT|nr:hypothetical protein SAMN02745166_05130 [Prosthecobacter debontii]
MATHPWYKILALAFFWDFSTHGAQGRLEVFLPVLLLIFLLDARGVKTGNQAVGTSWAAWPLFASLAVLAVGVTYLSTEKPGGQNQAGGGCSSYQGCGGSLAASGSSGNTSGCQCQSKTKAPANVNYRPVQRPSAPNSSVPLKRTFNGAQSGPTNAIKPRIPTARPPSAPAVPPQTPPGPKTQSPSAAPTPPASSPVKN